MNPEAGSFNWISESYSRAGKERGIKKGTCPALLLVISVAPQSYFQKIKESPQNHRQANPKEYNLFWGSLLFAFQQETVICLSLAKVYTAKTPQQLCSNPSLVIKDCRIQALNRFYYL